MKRILCTWAFALAACAHVPSSNDDAPKIPETLHFIEDDYELALAHANERGVPLFIAPTRTDAGWMIGSVWAW